MDDFNIEPFHARPGIKIQFRVVKKIPLCKIEVNDCGRAVDERKDCTVRSLAKATGKDYEIVHRFLEKAGRKPCKGFPFARYLNDHVGQNILGKTIKKLLPCEGNFGQFVNNHKKGNFILRSQGHVAAVKNGILFDDGDSSRQTLLQVWEFI